MINISQYLASKTTNELAVKQVNITFNLFLSAIDLDDKQRERVLRALLDAYLSGKVDGSREIIEASGINKSTQS